MKNKVENLIKFYTHIKNKLESEIDDKNENANLVEKGQLNIVKSIIADLVDLANELEEEREIE